MNFKILTLLLSLTLITRSKDCNNTLLDTLSLPRLYSPIVLIELPYCKNVISTTPSSCTSVDIIGSLQYMQNGFKDSLQEKAGARDKLIRDCVNKFEELKVAAYNYNKMRTNLNDLTMRAKIDARVAPLFSLIDRLNPKMQTYINQFSLYQYSRATCFREIVRIQGAAYCLASDPDYMNRGVDEYGNVTMSNGVCSNIISACFEYLQYSYKQNDIVAIAKAIDLFEGYTNITADLSGTPRFNSVIPPLVNEQYVPVKDYRNQRLDEEGVPVVRRSNIPKDDSLKTIEVPFGCSDPANPGDCVWLCDTAFYKGAVNQSMIVAGGDINSKRAEFRRRVLTGTSEWTFTPDEIGTTIGEVDPNPGKVTLVLGATNLAFKLLTLLSVILLYLII